MDDLAEKGINDINKKETTDKEKENIFANKYKEQLKDTDLIKEIENLKKRLAMKYDNVLNLNANLKQKEPEKEREKIEAKYDKDNDNKVVNPIRNDLKNISKIALNIVNKVALKKENKTIKDSDAFESNEEKQAMGQPEGKKSDNDSDEDKKKENINIKDTPNNKSKSNITDKSEKEEVKDEPIKLSELESDNENKQNQMNNDDDDDNDYNNDIDDKDINQLKSVITQSQLNQIQNQNQNNYTFEPKKQYNQEEHCNQSPEAKAQKEIENNKILQPDLKPKQKESHQLDSSSISNTFSVSQLNNKFQSQIKLIEEKSETNLIEHEQNLKELRKIEETLLIDERITHENREIRKNACKEITAMCTEEFTEEEKKEFFECFSPWVKYYIEETNPYVLPEALNFFLVFNLTFPEFKVNSLNDFFDNLERIASFGISSLNDSSRKIIEMFIKDKKLFNQTFTELMKGWNSSSIRLIKFLHDLISDMIIKGGIFNENCIKIIFEKSIHLYLSINSKNNEKKKVNGKLISFIYTIIEDDLNTIQNSIYITSKKEFNALLSKVEKSNHEPKYRLYSQNDNIPTIANIDSQGHNANDRNSNLKIRNQITQQANENSSNMNQNNPQMNNIPSEVNDLYSIFPNDFFEFNLLTQYAEKISILEEVNRILQNVNEVRDRDKNYIEIYKALTLSIEDSNILIHLEGIKVFKHISRLLQSQINNQKVKSLLEYCFEKFKDKKTIVRDELFSLFDAILSNQCLTFDSFIVLVLQFCLNNQRKAVSIVKQGVLDYLKQLMKNSNAAIKECIVVKSEKCYLTYSKYLIDLIANESQSNIKDLCTDLLLVFKSKMRNMDNIAQLNALTQNLPNYRKNIVINDKTDYCSSESNTNYKRKLKNVKSNIPSKSISKDKRLNSSFRKDTLSTPKNMKLNHNKLIKQNSHTNNMQKHNSSNNVVKSSQSKDTLTNKVTNMRVIKKDSNDSDSENENNETKKHDLPNKSDKENKDLTHINEEKKKKELLEKRKDDVVNHISTLNKKALEEYSKVIVRDFLFFVNKVSLGLLKDDLSSHFEVIFNILGKLLERMLHLNRKKDLDGDIDLTESTSNQISDDLIIRIIKVVIILPCIDQVEGSSEFDLNQLNSFIASIKQASTTEEKFFVYLLINLIKFTNKGQGFLEKINPKPSILFFLDYITLCKVRSEKVQLMLNEFVEKTELLSKEEKLKYLTIKGVSPISSREVTQNIDNEEDEEEEQEEEGNEAKQNDNNNIAQIKQEDEDFLARRIKESEELIKLKQDENERLKQKIKQYEEKKIIEKQSNTLVAETTTSNQIIPVPDQASTPSVPTIQSQGNAINKIIEESKDRIINSLKSANSGDILKIKEQFNVTTKKLDLTLKRMIEKTENKDKERNIQDQILSQIKQTPIKNQYQTHDPMRTNTNNNNNILTPIKQIRNLEDCLLEEQEQSLFPHDTKSEIQLAINQTPQSNSSSIQDIFNLQKESLPNYKPVVKQLVSFFEGHSHHLNIDDLFNQLSLIYHKLKVSDLKLDYINYLKSKLCTSDLLEKIPVNAYLQFYDYVIHLLSIELLVTPRDNTLVMHLQAIIENLRGYRRLSEMIQMMMLLLRKYFPKNLNDKLSDISCVTLQVIAYLIKELVKLIGKNKVEANDIISEINELFTITPPDSLKSSTPNYKLYEHIFTVLKSLTDEVYDQNKYSFKEVIEYLNENKITNKAYLKYLNNLCEMSN